MGTIRLTDKCRKSICRSTYYSPFIELKGIYGNSKTYSNMNTFLLSVPLKETEDVEWKKPLNSYLVSIYGSSSEYQHDLNSLEKIRQDIRGVNKDLTGLRLYYKYFSMLELIDLRIPFTYVNKSKNIKFTWYDAFEPSVSHAQTALPFEKASTLFNIAALLSAVGRTKYEEAKLSSPSQDADNCLKETLQYLQQAAGVFIFLQDNFLHAPSEDLHSSTIGFLVRLMLAQSQEIFTLKAISGDLEQKQNSLISKLCQSTSKHYEDSTKMNMSGVNNGKKVGSHDAFTIIDSNDLSEGDLDFDREQSQDGEDSNNVTASIDPLWIAILKFKASFYRALAYYYNGLQLEKTQKFGTSIAYLTKALNTLTEIPGNILKSIAKSGSAACYELIDSFKAQKSIIEIKLADVTKDNNFIYNEIVPSLVTLPEIKALDAVKPIPLNGSNQFIEINEHNYGNFLTNVVPLDTHELLSYYSEEKAQLLRNEIDHVEVSNEELASVLEYYKLPQELNRIEDAIKQKSDVTERAGTLASEASSRIKKISLEIFSTAHEDEKNRQEISRIKMEIQKIVQESEIHLKNNNYEAYAEYKNDLIKLKKSLLDANKSDGVLFSLVSGENENVYRLLTGGPESTLLKNMLGPKASSSIAEQSYENEVSLLDIDDREIPGVKKADSSPEGLIDQLKTILSELSNIRVEKSKLIEELKKDIHKDDISDIIILNSKFKSSKEIKKVIFPEELKKFESYGQELDRLVSTQNEKITSLKETWTALLQDAKVTEALTQLKEQEDRIQSFKSQVDAFYEEKWRRYHSGLASGVSFYNQLLSYAQGLRDDIRSLTQEMALHSDLARSFTGLSVQLSGLGYSSMQQPQGAFPNPAPHLSHFPPAPKPVPERTASTSSLGSASFLHRSDSFTYPRPPPLLPPKVLSTSSGPTPDPVPSSRSGSHDPSRDNLIYNQPSKYEPNMYNFFSKN